jgi:hypothetical protein
MCTHGPHMPPKKRGLSFADYLPAKELRPRLTKKADDHDDDDDDLPRSQRGPDRKMIKEADAALQSENPMER